MYDGALNLFLRCLFLKGLGDAYYSQKKFKESKKYYKNTEQNKNRGKFTSVWPLYTVLKEI